MKYVWDKPNWIAISKPRQTSRATRLATTGQTKYQLNSPQPVWQTAQGELISRLTVSIKNNSYFGGVAFNVRKSHNYYLCALKYTDKHTSIFSNTCMYLVVPKLWWVAGMGRNFKANIIFKVIFNLQQQCAHLNLYAFTPLISV